MVDRSYARITIGGKLASIEDARFLITALKADGLAAGDDEGRASILHAIDNFETLQLDDSEVTGGTFFFLNDFVKSTPGLACSTSYDGCPGAYPPGYFGIERDGTEHSSASDGEEPSVPLSALLSCFDQGDLYASMHLQRLIHEARAASGKDIGLLTAGPGVLVWLENGDSEGADVPGTPGDLREFATAEEIQAARDLYDGNDVNVDNGAKVSVADDAVWVQAWVRVPNDEPDVDHADSPLAVAFDRDGAVTPRAVIAPGVTTQDGTVIPPNPLFIS